jgi:transposase
MHLGIDGAKAKLDCALRLADGGLKNKVVDNNPSGFKALSAWLEKQGATTVHACMEATGLYWEAAAEYLVAQGVMVSVVNPAQIKAFGASRMVRSKTDRVDAQLIAAFCYERNPAPWQAPSAAQQALQAMRTQESNRLEVAREVLKAGIARHLEWLDQEIEALSKSIRAHLDDDPTLKDKGALLESIPGLGERTIAILLAFYADIERFRNARQAAAFAGLDPRHQQSGSSRPRQTSPVEDRPRLPAQGPLPACHGDAVQDRLGQAFS